MTLESNQLREIDRAILKYLREGRVRTSYVRKRIIAEQERESITSQYIGQRLQRFAEHDHVEDLFGSGLYELINDPESEDERESDNEHKSGTEAGTKT